MCQMKVVLDQDGEQEKIMENVTQLQMKVYWSAPFLKSRSW